MDQNITRISKRPGNYATYEIRKMITDKVGIIGLGFVGSAINSSLEMMMHTRLTLVDPAKGYTDKIEDCIDCTGIFVCVPSPMGEDGSCDTSILESVLRQLKEIGYNGVIISKCTAPPDVYERLNAEYPNLVHAPEFLTAANAVSDYANGSFAMIGGRVPAYQREAERIIRISQQHLGEHIIYCSIGEAALAKYTINSFLATKVIFMNEIYNLSQKLGLRYEVIAAMYTMDPRIGKSHTVVPGPDGAFGFGGACFPKDTAALLKIAEQHASDMMVLDAAVKKNTLLRLTEPK
jgi:UDPglucose 6-dehydrogenase